MITQSKVRRIEEKFNDFLETLSEEEKLDFKTDVSQYNALSLNLGITFTLSKSCEENYKLQRNLCLRVGLPQNVIGMSFRPGNSTGERTIINIKPRNTKYPVIVRCETTNRNYKYPVSMVISELGGVKMINRNANLEQLVK